MKVTLFRDLPTERWWSMERYADELLAALRALGVDARAYAPRRPWPHLRGAANTLLNYGWRVAVYPALAHAQQGDLNHIIDHSYAHLLYALDPRRTVVTCHDIAPLALNERGRGVSYALWRYALRALPRAAHITADSHHTQAELLRHLALPATRLSMVPLGIRPVPPPTPAPQRLTNTVLHVGSCLPRKNLPTLLRALAELPEAQLVQVGGQLTTDQHALVAELGLTSRLHATGYATEADLHRWYHTATVLAFPSRYEGFGLPVLEAMSAGLPVITSTTTSLPEVAGSAALLVDPDDVAGLAQAIRRVLADAGLRATLVERGRAHSQRFSWDATARATLAVYQQVADTV